MSIVDLELDKNMHTKNTQRFAFICETQLHIFNAINFVANNIENSKTESDIFIYNNFINAKSVAEKTKGIKLFKNVFFIEKYNENIDFFTKFRNLFRLFFPKTTLSNHIVEKANYKNKKYKYLCMYSYTMRTRNFLRSFPDAEVIMIEDGIGAYFSNTMKDHITGVYKILDKYVFRGKYDCNPKRLYLYCPELSDREVTENVIKLPSINTENAALNMAYKVFDYKSNDRYKDKKYIYFTQPLEMIPGGFIENSEEKVYSLLEDLKLNKDLIFRVHPRQTNVRTYGCTEDENGNMWELESPFSIKENHVLISAFSTAAFTPKYINGIEPYVIFTYRLNFQEHDSVYWKKVEKYILNFKSLYKNKDKVFIPSSYGELKDILCDVKDS